VHGGLVRDSAGGQEPAEAGPEPACSRSGPRGEGFARQRPGQQGGPPGTQPYQVGPGGPEPGDGLHGGDLGRERLEGAVRGHGVAGDRAGTDVRGAGGKPRVPHPERFQHEAGGRAGVRQSGDVGDQLPEHAVPAVARPGDPARATAGDDGAHERAQVRNAVGVDLLGAVDPAGVAEQFPYGHRIVGQPDRAQAVVGGGVQAQPALGHQPEHRGRGDQRGHAGRAEPAAGLQRLGPVQVGMPPGDHPRRAAGLAAGQDQGGQAQLGAGLLGQAGYLVRGLTEGAGRRRRLGAGVGDPVAEGKSPQPGQPVRRCRVGHRDIPQPGQLNLGLQRPLADDHELGAQVRGHLGGLLHQVARRKGGQHAVVEMLPELVLTWSRPLRPVGTGETRDNPAQVGQGVAFLPVARLLQRGPVRQAEFAGDGGLGIVQGGELTRGQAAFRLESEVPQAGPSGQ
jgi:hypothetical protein